MNDRIKLAEAMGWWLFKDKHWQPPGVVPINWDTTPLPDPFTDANDCEALMHWLMADGWHIEIAWQADHEPHFAAGAYVHIWQEGTEIHHRADYDSDRWKQCVCELALKVIE